MFITKKIILVVGLCLVEVIAYYLQLLLIFNLFIILYFWFTFIYSFFGLTAKERSLKSDYPIKYSFSLLYLLKIIIRGIRIKYIIIKGLCIELMYSFRSNKNYETTNSLFYIWLKVFVLVISLVCIRYVR